ncbi:MAG: hypothetical protein AAGH65_11945, partial [Pseudomonadota bacterium]
MRSSLTIALGLLAIGCLSGCATSPFEGLDGNVAPIGPADALSSPFRSGEHVIWGGQIVGVNTLETVT